MSDIDNALGRLYSIGLSGAPSIDAPDGGKIVVLPDGFATHKVEPLEEPLTRIKQSVHLHDADSAVAYINRYKTDATQLFAEPGFIAESGRAVIYAIFDYHAPGNPDRLAHKAVYMPRYSDQWNIWKQPRKLSQLEFCEFIEENRGDIVAPEAASLLDMVRQFKSSKKTEYQSVVYQPNGEIKLAYSELEDKGPMSTAMPQQLDVGIPVYFRGQNYSVPILVRYRVANGGVQFELKPDRLDLIEDHAFNELSASVGEATGVQLYLGRVYLGRVR